jgi:hypothetical protein
MKPKYYQAGRHHGHRDRWMVSYLDVLTILLILFVATAAQALKSAPRSLLSPRLNLATPGFSRPSANWNISPSTRESSRAESSSACRRPSGSRPATIA